MIYLTIFVVLMLLALYYDFGRARGNGSVAYFVAYLMLVALAGFRFKVGGDTYNYMYMHEFIPTLTGFFDADIGIAKLQPLWLLMSALAKSISEEFFVLQVLHALIVNAVIFWHINGNTRYKFTAIFFYYFSLYPYFNFEILRESMAIACFLLALKSYNNARWGRYYSWVLAAFLFHLSAIVLFFLPLARRINPNPLALVMVFAVSAVLNPYVMSFLGGASQSAMFASAGDYVEYNYSLYGLASLFLFYVAYPMALVHIAKNVMKLESPYYNLAHKALLIGSLTPLFFIFFRFFNYFSIFILMIAVEIANGLVRTRGLRRMAVVTVPVFLSAVLVFNTAKYFSDVSKFVKGERWYSYWYPYYSIFDPATDPVRERLVDETRQF